MNKGILLVIGIIIILIAVLCVSTIDNEEYRVNYNVYQYNVDTDELKHITPRSCTVTIDGVNDPSENASRIEMQRIKYEVWEFELSNNTIIADSIDINCIQRVK